MPYFMIQDFSGGLDLRKDPVLSRPNTLQKLTNGFINAGGEVEKRKALTAIGNLPAGQTKGIGFRDNQLVVLGTAATTPAGMPAWVAYQYLNTAGALDRILDTQVFGSKLYTVVRLTDASVAHFYGSDVVTGTGGTNVRPHKSKMYAIDGQNLRFSAVKNASDWTGTGSGIIDVSTEDAGAADLVGIEQYYGLLALFGRNSVQVWDMDPDPALNTQQQVLGNIGLVAPNAVARYGNGDVLFLSHTGIRSLRARDASNAAVLNDIGSPIDSLIYSLRAILDAPTVDRITAVVDPLTGHFWLAWGRKVIVLSYYPNSKVTAWSTYEFPIEIDYITLAGSRLVVRSGDFLFIYGTVPVSGSPFDPNSPVGTDPAEYDSAPVTVITPMIDVQQPATMKDWQGLDIACTGTWDVYVNPNHTTPDVWTKVARVAETTFEAGRISINATSTHLAVKCVSVGPGPAKLSGIAIHYAGGEAS